MSWSCGEKKTIFNGQCFPRIAIFHLPTWVSFWWNNWRSVSTLEKIKELKTNFWSFPGWSFPGWNLKLFSRKGKRVFGIADSRHEMLPTGALDHPYALCTDDRDSRRSPWIIHVHKQFEFLESDTVFSIYTRDSVFWHYYIGDGFNTVIYTSRRVESSSIFGWKFSKDCWSQLAYGTLYTICGISLI